MSGLTDEQKKVARDAFGYGYKLNMEDQIYAAVEAILAMPTQSHEGETHSYTSTACFHGLHDRCRRTCKFCGVGCNCSCGHPDRADEGTPADVVERIVKRGVRTEKGE